MQPMREHGSGSIFQRKKGRGKGRWVAVVTQRDGRRASRTAKTREEAKAALAELLRLRDARAPITRNIRLSDYLERWVSSDHGWAPSTRRKHESAIRVHLIPALGHIRLSELSGRDVDDALGRLGHLQPRSLAHLRASLRRSLADAVRDGLVARNAGVLSRPIRQTQKERVVLDANQARILIESTRNTVYGPLWTLLVTTGLRISEALGLSWSDVDFGEPNMVRVAPGMPAGDHRQAGHEPSGRNGRGNPESPRRAIFGGNDARDLPVQLSQRGRAGSADVPLSDRKRAASITVRRQLARENGEWVHRPPKTAKGRRTIPLTPLGVEALRAQRTQQREWMAAYYSDLQSGGPRLGNREPVGGHRQAGHEPSGRNGRGNPEPPRPAVTPIDTLVFTTSRGKPLHETNTLAALHRDLAAAGLPRVSQHSLRHAAATILFEQGLPIEAIADMLGHSTVRITQDLYRHSVASFSALAADKMQEALG